jgi:hypothetical protein
VCGTLERERSGAGFGCLQAVGRRLQPPWQGPTRCMKELIPVSSTPKFFESFLSQGPCSAQPEPRRGGTSYSAFGPVPFPHPQIPAHPGTQSHVPKPQPDSISCKHWRHKRLQPAPNMARPVRHSRPSLCNPPPRHRRASQPQPCRQPRVLGTSHARQRLSARVIRPPGISAASGFYDTKSQQTPKLSPT